ncbi:response regulator transcription factor, partial [Eggerthella sinensis]|uniref:response regulator transcription factor n=1 Tax=Eggerthella sinensis TaxID=242230 RepID=UPI0022E6D16D
RGLRARAARRRRGRGLLDADADAGEASRLTEREVDVVRCIASGLTIAESAERLFVSRETVKKHLPTSTPSWACIPRCRPSPCCEKRA